jgi:hypothetical protein
MTVPLLHVFMRDLLSDNVGEHVGCPGIALIVDNAANPQNNFRAMEQCTCEMESHESPTPRSYPGWSRMSPPAADKQNCLDLSDHSKGISRWGGPSLTSGRPSRFDSGTPVTNKPEVPPVAPPRMMSPAVTCAGKKGLHKAVDISPSKEASLRKYKDQYYKKRYNVHQLRRDGPTREDLSNAVERALKICETRSAWDSN